MSVIPSLSTLCISAICRNAEGSLAQDEGLKKALPPQLFDSVCEYQKNWLSLIKVVSEIKEHYSFEHYQSHPHSEEETSQVCLLLQKMLVKIGKPSPR